MGQPGRPSRVFLSRTSELRRFPTDSSSIATSQEAVVRAGHAVADMAYFAAHDEKPAQVCRDAVTGGDVYVVVAGFGYGSPMRDEPEHSYTELEFDAATDACISRLVFLLPPDADGPDDLFTDTERGDRQQPFRARLRGAGLTASDLLGVAGACASAAIAWNQLNQNRNLVSLYRIAARELGIIRDRVDTMDEAGWAAFISDAEDAVSREHTLWLARHGHSGVDVAAATDPAPRP